MSIMYLFIAVLSALGGGGGGGVVPRTKFDLIAIMVDMDLFVPSEL